MTERLIRQHSTQNLSCVISGPNSAGSLDNLPSDQGCRNRMKTEICPTFQHHPTETPSTKTTYWVTRQIGNYNLWFTVAHFAIVEKNQQEQDLS